MKSSAKVVLIGSEGLIGKAIYSGLKDRWDVLRADLRGSNDVVAVDITNRDSLLGLIKGAGEVGAVINCAYPRGEGYGNPLSQVTFQTFCGNVNAHLGGSFLVSQVFGEHFEKRGGGNVIQFASIYGVNAPRFDIYEGNMTNPVEYAAIKAGIIHLNRYFAKYYKGKKIRFNCISPGGVFNGHDDQFVEKYSAYALNKGMLDAKDLVGATEFLLSESSDMINGQNLVVDDGWTL